MCVFTHFTQHYATMQSPKIEPPIEYNFSLDTTAYVFFFGGEHMNRYASWLEVLFPGSFFDTSSFASLSSM